MKYFYSVLFSFIALAIISSSVYSQQNQRTKIEQLINSIQKNNLYNTIVNLENAGGHKTRVTFTAGQDSAGRYIYSKFNAIKNLDYLEIDTFYISGASSPYNKRPLYNIIATIKGKVDSNKIFVLGAHYDCSGSRMSGQTWQQQWSTLKIPGADDNATGVAVIIELARLLSDTTIKFESAYTIKFVAFAAEESGIVMSGSHFGSMDYAGKLDSRNANVLGMFSIDMIGYNNNYLYQSIVADSASRWLGNKVLQANTDYSINLITNDYPYVNATYSDHASFWNYGYPAILLIENAPPWNNNQYYVANPYYHKTSDSTGTVNMELVTRVAKLTMATVGSLTDSIVTSVNNPTFPTNYSLSQNYPNPFNPSTMIEYDITTSPSIPLLQGEGQRERSVTLKIYDLMGREVKTLVNENQLPGKYSVEWNASEYPSGVYFYELNVGDYRNIKKMILMK